jgi:hypothetical protein
LGLLGRLWSAQRLAIDFNGRAAVFEPVGQGLANEDDRFYRLKKAFIATVCAKSCRHTVRACLPQLSIYELATRNLKHPLL